ncbi:hypothetical protein CRG98_004433 [Punica granatum]|nr:hypothetical protein CRG98_004433 [Punica granatum]
MQIKLVRGNSAGTVVAYYLRSPGLNWDEIDFEFLGNLTGHPYVLHTNIFTGGQGNREQQFYLWFDPTAAFHTYSVVWNPSNIIIYVDNTPIREFKNLRSVGVPYPMKQPMRVFGSLWDADDWATRGGLVKTNWTLAPFTASFRNLNYDACIISNGRSSCKPKSSKRFMIQKLDLAGQNRLKAVQSKYMIYNYCVDKKRFPIVPIECTLS